MLRAVTSLTKITIGLSAVVWLGTGCLGSGRWFPDPHPPAPGVLLMQKLAPDSALDFGPTRIPEIPARRKARMCCAFGTDMTVKVGEWVLPFLKVGQIKDLTGLGPHRYDGATAAIDDSRQGAFPGGEANGLMYTCNGGFIDTAHVRETVDWAAYFVSVLDRDLETGTTVELSPEGADRRIVIPPVPPELIAEYGRDELIIGLAQWLSYQGSVWHEIAQWYGWSLVTLYPETLSGFSPEDPISNAIGVNLLSGVDVEQLLSSEKTYNAHVDQLIQRGLEDLNPVSADLAADVVQAVDGVWWDSQASLPDNEIVLRRYLDIDTELEAWLMPEHVGSPDVRARLDEQCGENPEPAKIHIRDSVGGVPFDELATFEIMPTGKTAEQPVFRQMTLPISQRDFPHLVEEITAKTRAELGPRADLPA